MTTFLVVVSFSPGWGNGDYYTTCVCVVYDRQETRMVEPYCLFYSPCCTIYLPPSVPGKISPYVQFIRGDTPAGTLPAKHFNSKSLL